MNHRTNPGATSSSGPSSKVGLGFVWISICVALLVSFFFTPQGRMVLNVFVGVRHIKAKEAKLQKPQVYEPVARRLAAYCQSDQSLFPEYLSYAWLPTELARVGHGRCSITTNYAQVEMGGGFHHFGYRLKIDETASSSATNVWQLSLYGEGGRDIRLMKLAISKAVRVDASQLEKLVLAGFDESPNKGSSDIYRSKVLAQLRFGKTSDAAKTCKEWIGHQPDSWLPRFTYAHVRCRLDDYESASVDFENWMRANQNFAHCIYFALFALRETRTNDALQAVSLALKQPFAEPAGTEGNKFYLGQNAALIAFAAGNYDLCLAMCDKMLADSKVERWWRRSVLRIAAAGCFMKNDQAQALASMRAAESFADHDSFSAESMSKADVVLRQALERKDLGFIKDFQNWVDEMDTWFSPFETDETGVHGTGLNIPTPYPKSWESDRMYSGKN